jgi:ParB-like chromosome segregation protein Spo0J|tara:strand:- start:1484 stop:2008 length:525 start_codon:yes stop_codon:yes gene_type:complete
MGDSQEKQPGFTVDSVAVSDLLPWAQNPRVHTTEQVDLVSKSIEHFGFTNPIIADDENNVLAGHARLEAAKRAGLSEVPVIHLGDLSDADKRAYVITDNQLTIVSEWDTVRLQEELALLSDENYDLALTGFTDDELSAFLEPTDLDFPEVDITDDEPEDPTEIKCPSCGHIFPA